MDPERARDAGAGFSRSFLRAESVRHATSLLEERMPRRNPPCLDWELKLTEHLEERRIDRGFNEVDLRLMLTDPDGVSRGALPSRWILTTRLHGRRWKVVVEPAWIAQRLEVITAWATGGKS
jgi:hypothetical protein